MELKEAQRRLNECQCGLGVIETYGWFTTFRQDFQFAELDGVWGVKDTYKRAFGDWKNDIIYLTELYVVLCWRCDSHYERGNIALGEAYNDLRKTLDKHIFKNFKGEELQYFIRFTD